MYRRCHSAPALLPNCRPSSHPPSSHLLPSASAQPSASNSPRHPRPKGIHGTADIEALILHLQSFDALPTTLELALPADTEAEALTRLLNVVDALAELGTLTALRVTVEGSDHGPIDEALREALAGSRACLVLSGKTVRPLIFRDLAQVHRELNNQMLGEALDTFLDMQLCTGLTRALEVQAADLLAKLAMETGEDSLLRATAVLSPHYQWRLKELPDPLTYARLERAGVACCLALQLNSNGARSLADWLGVAHPLLQAIELLLVESLDVDTSMPLWTRLASQCSIQRVEVEIFSDVTIEWTPRTAPALAPMARTNTMRIRLHDRPGAPPQVVAHLVEWFQPMHLRLRVRWVPAGASMLDAIGKPVHHRPLDSLSLTCETPFGAGELALSLALLDFLERFDRVHCVCVRTHHALPSQPVLRDLEGWPGKTFCCAAWS